MSAFDKTSAPSRIFFLEVSGFDFELLFWKFTSFPSFYLSSFSKKNFFHTIDIFDDISNFEKWLNFSGKKAWFSLEILRSISFQPIKLYDFEIFTVGWHWNKENFQNFLWWRHSFIMVHQFRKNNSYSFGALYRARIRKISQICLDIVEREFFWLSEYQNRIWIAILHQELQLFQNMS